MTKQFRLRPLLLLAALGALPLGSCVDPYYSVGGSYGTSYQYGAGYGYGNPSFSTSMFVSTGSPRWGYDPVCYSYYDYTSRRYYDPYLCGYYPVGYRPPVIVGVPHPHGYSGRYCPPPARVVSVTLSNYHNRYDCYRNIRQPWASQVRMHESYSRPPGRYAPSVSPYQGSSWFGGQSYGGQSYGGQSYGGQSYGSRSGYPQQGSSHRYGGGQINPAGPPSVSPPPSYGQPGGGLTTPDVRRQRFGNYGGHRQAEQGGSAPVPAYRVNTPPQRQAPPISDIRRDTAPPPVPQAPSISPPPSVPSAPAPAPAGGSSGRGRGGDGMDHGPGRGRGMGR